MSEREREWEDSYDYDGGFPFMTVKSCGFLADKVRQL